jgi:hypothetical protein
MYRAKRTKARGSARHGSRSPAWWYRAKDNLGIVAFALGAAIAIVWQVLHALGFIHSHH